MVNVRPGHSQSGHSWLGIHRPASIDTPTRGLRYDQDEKIHPGWLCQGVIQIVLHFLHAELTNLCNACSSFLFSRSATHDCHDPISIVYLVTAGTLWCKNTQSHLNKHYKQRRSNCFPHRYPEPACKCHYKNPSSPIPGEPVEGREHQDTSFFILHWRILDLRARDVRCVRARTFERWKKNQAFVCRAQAGTFCIYTHIHLYISVYIAVTFL